MREKIDIRKIAYTLTEEDVKEAIMQERIRAMLGIYAVYDEVQGHKHKNYVPSVYKSLDEYEIDKSEANIFIYNNRTVPKPLADKLIAARKELESLGLLEPYIE